MLKPEKRVSDKQIMHIHGDIELGGVLYYRSIPRNQFRSLAEKLFWN